MTAAAVGEFADPRVERLARRDVLGMRVDASSYADATDRIAAWVERGRPGYVCVASVNNVMQARDRVEYMRVMNEADLVVPDGRPLVWSLRALGIRDATQVRGTYLTEAILATAHQRGIRVGVLGGSPDVLGRFRNEAARRWPGLDLSSSWSPPFRPLSADEERAMVREIRDSRVRILLVALGCPKQEIWMSEHRDDVPAVMVGVGAAIDFIAGTKRQAPLAMQRAGVEWLFRLASEPRRLWRRYLSQNPRFATLFAAQLLTERVRRTGIIERRYEG